VLLTEGCCGEGWALAFCNSNVERSLRTPLPPLIKTLVHATARLHAAWTKKSRKVAVAGPNTTAIWHHLSIQYPAVRKPLPHETSVAGALEIGQQLCQRRYDFNKDFTWLCRNNPLSPEVCSRHPPGQGCTQNAQTKIADRERRRW
jgi:hypothetical protein